MGRGQYCHMTLNNEDNRTCLNVKGYTMDTPKFSYQVCSDNNAAAEILARAPLMKSTKSI
jgi:hypothetical protein